MLQQKCAKNTQQSTTKYQNGGGNGQKKGKVEQLKPLIEKGEEIRFVAGKYKGKTGWVNAAAENGSAKKMCVLIDASDV